MVCRWLRNTTMNSLAEVYKFYCGPDKALDKDVRNSFVTLSMAELSRDLDTLLSYCAGDVAATCEIARRVYPLYAEMCPHPATLAGMLAMSTCVLPTSNCWDRFLAAADASYDALQDELIGLVRTEAELALMLIMDLTYKQVSKIHFYHNIKHKYNSTFDRIPGFGTWSGRLPVRRPSRAA